MERQNLQRNEDNIRFRDTDLHDFLYEIGEFPNDDLDASLAKV